MTTPLEGPIYTCIECGAAFTTRPGLEAHWADEGHGPENVQLDAIDRARHAIEPVPDIDPA